MITIPTNLIETLALQSPSGLGTVVANLTIDWPVFYVKGIEDSERPNIVKAPLPASLAILTADEPCTPDDQRSTTVSYAPQDGGYTLTLHRLSGESEVEAYIVLQGEKRETILHSRDVRGRDFGGIVLKDGLIAGRF
jgi:hypothetical protein